MTDLTIIPTSITKFDRTDAELEAFALFSVLVAGKNSDTTARLVSRLVAPAVERGMTPFEYLRDLGPAGIYSYLVAHRAGQYARVAKCLSELIHVDLRTVTVPGLMQVHGIGPKTARFFVLHTRRDAACAVLDTHILRWMREDCGVEDAPLNTPPEGPLYRSFENLCVYLMRVHFPGLSVAEADLMVWTLKSGRLS